MSRKKVKIMLLIAGVAMFAAGLAMFIIDIGSFSSHRPRGFKSLLGDVIIPFYVFALIGIVPLSAASLMHSKDIQKIRPNMSSFLKALACFWMIGGALSAAALILICIFLLN